MPQSRYDLMMGIILGFNIVTELLLPIPFIGFFFDAFFLKVLGLKRMYEILLITTAIVYVTKFNVFFWAGNFLGMWFPILIYLLMPLAAVIELCSIILFSWIYQKLFANLYRRLAQI